MMRGTPYIYQGEELGMTNAHYSDISQYRDVESLNYYEILLSEGKSKEEALEILAAKSRDNSRTPMQWSADVNAGFSEAEPWISVIDNYKEINAEKEMQDPDSIYSFYKKLVELRKEKAVISEGTIEFFERENADVCMRAVRWHILCTQVSADRKTCHRSQFLILRDCFLDSVFIWECLDRPRTVRRSM